MSSLVDWLKRLFYSVTSPSLPDVAGVELLLRDPDRNLKVSSLTAAKCGILFCPYHNISRHDAWIKCLDKSGRVRTVYYSNRVETFGTPDLVDGGWVYPVEEPNGRVRIVSDANGNSADGPRQPEQYATRCVAGVIGVNGRGEKPFLWDALKNRRLHTFDAEGIISGLARIGGYWVAAIMDGGKPGLYSTRGWRIVGKFPEVVNLNGELIAFEKSGAVEVYGADGWRKRQIGSTGMKPQRARVRGGLVFFTTANWDGLWVTDGKRLKLLYEWRDGDRHVNDGSLFNTSLDFLDAKTLAVARSVDGKGYEIWKVRIK